MRPVLRTRSSEPAQNPDTEEDCGRHMSQARDHGGGRRQTRPFRNRAGPAASVRRAVAQLAAGAPVLPVLIVSVIVLADLAGGGDDLAAHARRRTRAGRHHQRTARCPLRRAPRRGAGRGARHPGRCSGPGTGGRSGPPWRPSPWRVPCQRPAQPPRTGARRRPLGRRDRPARAAQARPARVGPFQVAVRYSAAAAEARIGGISTR